MAFEELSKLVLKSFTELNCVLYCLKFLQYVGTESFSIEQRS